MPDLESKNALIFFTRVPIPRRTKTRLLDFLTPLQAAKLHKFLIKNINLELKKLKDTKIFVFYTPANEAEILQDLLDQNYEFKAQSDGELSERMLNAFKELKEAGFEKILLIGSDIVGLNAQILRRCFEFLDKKDAVVIPTLDGGYCAIGLAEKSLKNGVSERIFSSDYETRKDVCKGVCAKFEELNLSYRKFKPLRDIDTKEDIFAHILRLRPNAVKPLASGEYNINYKFKRGDENFVFRINTKSQTGLKNQIKYEFDALKILEISGVTPRPLEYFKPSAFLPRGAMTMEFLKGRALRYESDLDIAAMLLSKIHGVEIPSSNSLIKAQKPLLAMQKECANMASVYLSSKFANAKTSEYLNEFLNVAAKFDLDRDVKDPCIINTELNSRNFIIGQNGSFIIDWEKPIIGEREQDLAHFLVPTTTFWKTDTILSENDAENFIRLYESYAKKVVNRAKFKEYFTLTCLRGVSWCAMAFVEYSGERAIKNEYTFNKIKEYLSDKFLSKLSKYFKEIE